MISYGSKIDDMKTKMAMIMTSMMTSIMTIMKLDMIQCLIKLILGK